MPRGGSFAFVTWLANAIFNCLPLHFDTWTVPNYRHSILWWIIRLGPRYCGFKSWRGRIVIEVVNMQCSKLFKVMECATYYVIMVQVLWSTITFDVCWKRVGHIPQLRVSSCRDITTKYN